MDQLAPFLLNFQSKETPLFKTLGRHLFMKCYYCDRAILNDVEQQTSLFEHGERKQALI